MSTKYRIGLLSHGKKRKRVKRQKNMEIQWQAVRKAHQAGYYHAKCSYGATLRICVSRGLPRVKKRVQVTMEDYG